jgi:hypothetical protein
VLCSRGMGTLNPTPRYTLPVRARLRLQPTRIRGTGSPLEPRVPLSTSPLLVLLPPAHAGTSWSSTPRHRVPGRWLSKHGRMSRVSPRLESADSSSPTRNVVYYSDRLANKSCRQPMCHRPDAGITKASIFPCLFQLRCEQNPTESLQEMTTRDTVMAQPA